MDRGKKSTSGCLWIFVFGILSLITYVFINAFISDNFWLSLGLAIAFSLTLTTRWLGSPQLKQIFGNVFMIFFVLMGLRLFMVFFVELFNIEPEFSGFNKAEGVELTKLFIDNDSVAVFSSHRVWQDNFGNDYQASLAVREADYYRLRGQIEAYRLDDQSDFWGGLYDFVETNDRPSLDLVMATFEEIHKSKALNQMQFAEMVVSCVQDIPYSLVFQAQCEAPDRYERSIRNILESCPDCCIGNIPFGLQNPVSFLANLKGDCDTRTVLIFSILRHFNYDVAILNSDYYRHSIIGLNLPAAGLHKMHFGKKYMTWETTAKYFRIGELPSNFDNVNYWNVVLTSK